MQAVSDMPKYRIDRMSDDRTATFDQLVDESDETCLCIALELPWRDNHPDTSCIPAGVYTAHRRRAGETRHKYDVFELDNVPGRTHVQIHIANKPSQLRGCIAVGKTFGILDGEHAALDSGAAYDTWMKRNQGHDRIQVTIVDIAPAPLPQ